MHEMLAGVDEVAEILGVARETVERLPESNDLMPPFPRPLGTLELEGPVWYADEVEEWKRARAAIWRATPPGHRPTAARIG